MRPVIKGDAPYTSINCYQEARGYLIDRIGEYCSYCERKIPANLAVEHVEAKTHHPTKELEWDNLLLACTNCNSTKGHTNVYLSDYIWPHIDVSFHFFEYLPTSLIKANHSLSTIDTDRAERTLTLIGLNKKPSESDTTMSNRLWKHRLEAWEIALLNKERYIQSIDKTMSLNFIIDIAIAQGFFSVWMTVFKDFPEVCDNLVEAYIGTNLP